MFETILEALAEEALNPLAKVLLLRASGEAFCTGRERSAQTLAEMRAFRTTPLITVARVHGAALGFGMGFASSFSARYTIAFSPHSPKKMCRVVVLQVTIGTSIHRHRRAQGCLGKLRFFGPSQDVNFKTLFCPKNAAALDFTGCEIQQRFPEHPWARR